MELLNLATKIANNIMTSKTNSFYYSSGDLVILVHKGNLEQLAEYKGEENEPYSILRKDGSR